MDPRHAPAEERTVQLSTIADSEDSSAASPVLGEPSEQTRRVESEPGETPSPPLGGLAFDVLRAKPRNHVGIFYMVAACSLSAIALVMSLSPSTIVWLGGQLLLAFCLMQWLAMLHEAEHMTLFRTRWPNKCCAYLAGLFALIPADCWRKIHGKHHYWTGWQDKDVTTASLVPRKLHWVERVVVNTCWRLWIPLFAAMYRVPYWQPMLLWRMFPRRRDRQMLMANVFCYLFVYAAIFWSIGVANAARCFGLGLFLSLALQDLLILSQHTHIPMPLAGDRDVRPFSPLQQDAFTRSLKFPTWFSRLILLNFDAHSLHHIYPRIPGYDLHRLEMDTANSVEWWKWVLQSKAVRGDVLLFKNRDQTGLSL